MNAALEAVESVIRQSDEERFVIAELERLADDGIASAISVVDDIREVVPGRPATIGRMIGFAKSPEKMLDPIGRIKQAVE